MFITSRTSEALALSFPAGEGGKFRDDMNELVQLFQTELQKVFRTEDYEKQKTELLRGFDEKRDALMDQMSKEAAENDFQVKTTNSGIYFMPVVDGKPVGEEEYDDLAEDVKDVIEKNSQIVQEKASAIMRDIRELDKVSKRCVDQLDYKVGMFAIGHHVSAVQEKYEQNEKAVAYINAVKEDVLENISQFFEDEDDGEEGLASLLPMLSKKQPEDVTLKYKVNLIVDNSETKGAPVVTTFNPTYYNLVGEVEYDSGIWEPDHRLYENQKRSVPQGKRRLSYRAGAGYFVRSAGMGSSAPCDQDKGNQYGCHSGTAGHSGCAYTETGTHPCQYQNHHDRQQLLL